MMIPVDFGDEGDLEPDAGPGPFFMRPESSRPTWFGDRTVKLSARAASALRGPEGPEGPPGRDGTSWGGMFVESDDGLCTTANPMSGYCDCPEGYAPELMLMSPDIDDEIRTLFMYICY